MSERTFTIWSRPRKIAWRRSADGIPESDVSALMADGRPDLDYQALPTGVTPDGTTDEDESAATNGNARVFVVTSAVQVPGAQQIILATFEELPHPPATREEVRALSVKVAGTVRVQNARGGQLLGSAAQVQVYILGWQELGK